jgi:hypothetical protein
MRLLVFFALFVLGYSAVMHQSRRRYKNMMTATYMADLASSPTMKIFKETSHKLAVQTNLEFLRRRLQLFLHVQKKKTPLGVATMDEDEVDGLRELLEIMDGTKM